MKFVGRKREFRLLDAWLADIAEHNEGRLVALRGRRQVGKSRLVTEWLRRSRVAHVYFSAVKHASTGAQLEQFQRDALSATPPLHEADALLGSPPASWSDAFVRLRLAAANGPIVIVLDEFPWAAEADPTLESVLQHAWDRWLQHLPILLILIGSDVATMERLTTHDRPLFGRATDVRIDALDPAEISEALRGNRSASDVFGAVLSTGGYPRLVDEFARHESMSAFVRAGLADENSALAVVAQRMLDAEFPPDAQARLVLSAIGSSEVGRATFSNVVAHLDDQSSKTAGTALTRALRILVEQKRVVAIDVPAGLPANARTRRYRITDSYLRFWYRFVAPELANISRGRGDLALERFRTGYEPWRGVAIEPVVREALTRLAPTAALLGRASTIAPWWQRTGDAEVDIVACDRERVHAVGSIKWRTRRAFSSADRVDLARFRAIVPGAADAALVAVCPAGIAPNCDVDVVFDATDLLAAWER